MKTVALYTRDALLARKIELILKDYAKLLVTESYIAADLAIIDSASCDTAISGAYVLPYIELGGKRKAKPPLHKELIGIVSKLTDGEQKVITLLDDGRGCMLGTEKIKLTEVEAKLLTVLLERDGFVTREELLDKVWNNEKTVGVVNVYVHYLREKLEAHGEKIIISSRREGYMIDRKYKKGGVLC